MTRYGLLVLAVLAALGQSCSSESESAGGNSATAPPTTVDRLVEEGDIVWLDQTTLYILNQSRGLSIVGLADPSAPVLMGQVAVGGTPFELYLRGGYVFALTTGASSSSSSSLISVVDVRRPEAPKRLTSLAIDGKITNTRLVGDILYLASDSGRLIQSVSIADPLAVRTVDRLPLPIGNYGSHVHVTPTTFYVATESYGSTDIGECGSSSYDRDGCTTIMVVDISSPIGALRMGASYAMVGMLQDRWGIDAYEGVLRVLVARAGWWSSGRSTVATLRTFRSTTASQLEPIAWMSIQTSETERVKAVRFDGPRAYVVTFRQTDPLFTIDLSDPSKPYVAGHLQSPGWLDFIIPRGNRLLGVGRDQDTPGGPWRLQASLYDVSLLSKPTLMARTLFGANYTSLPDQADNYAKVVRVVDALGVLLVPYNSQSASYGSNADGRLEILSFVGDKLTTLGSIASAEPIVRAVPLPPSHVAAVTESAVGVIQLAPTVAVASVVGLAPVSPPVPDGSVDRGWVDAGSVDGGPLDVGLAGDARDAALARDARNADVGPFDGLGGVGDTNTLDGGFHD